MKNEAEKIDNQRDNGVLLLRDRIEEALAKYWYDTVYNLIDKHDHEKGDKSRKAFRKWIDDNLDLFTKEI